jgi:protein-L-isoaspartate(D-aspartate) O-methyltransferase
VANRQRLIFPGGRHAIGPDRVAYFTYRRLAGGEDRSELGAIGHGPEGAKLADRIAEHSRTWDQDRAAVPRLAVFPAGTPGRFTTRTVIDKRHTRLTFSW